MIKIWKGQLRSVSSLRLGCYPGSDYTYEWRIGLWGRRSDWNEYEVYEGKAIKRWSTLSQILHATHVMPGISDKSSTLKLIQTIVHLHTLHYIMQDPSVLSLCAPLIVIAGGWKVFTVMLLISELNILLAILFWTSCSASQWARRDICFSWLDCHSASWVKKSILQLLGVNVRSRLN